MNRVTMTVPHSLFAFALLRHNDEAAKNKARAAGYDLIEYIHDENTYLIGVNKAVDVERFNKWLAGVSKTSLIDVTDFHRKLYLHPNAYYNTSEGMDLDDHLTFIGTVLGNNIQVVSAERGINGFGHLALKDDRLWYVNFMPNFGNEGTGELVFTQFEGTFHEIPNGFMTGKPVAMQFKVTYNLKGRIAEN